MKEGKRETAKGNEERQEKMENRGRYKKEREKKTEKDRKRKIKSEGIKRK